MSATLCNALLLESVPAMAFVEHKSLGTACSNSMPGTAGTVQPLDWTFTWNAIYAEQVWSWLRAGAWPFLHASWSCFEELCGRAFSTAYVTSLCLQSVSGSAVWIQTWRAPCPHSDTTRFWSSFQWISAPAFFCACSQQSSMASLSSRSSVWDAEGLQPFCTQNLRRATLWQSLIMSMCHMRTEPRLDWLPLLPPWHEPLLKSARGANQTPRAVAKAVALVLWHRSTTWLAMVCFH